MFIFSMSDVIAGAMAEIAAGERFRRSQAVGPNARERMARLERTNSGPFEVVFCPEAEAPAEQIEEGGR